MDSIRKKELEIIAYKIRKHAVTGVYNAGSGHPGGSLSIAEILSVLYFDEMNVNPLDSKNPDRDRFVLSKGHCCPGYYGWRSCKVCRPRPRRRESHTALRRSC